MNKEYKITREQFEEITYYKTMFETHADTIKWLCEKEKDDVVYGFQLGQTYSHMRQCFIGMLELESKIREQNRNDE